MIRVMTVRSSRTKDASVRVHARELNEVTIRLPTLRDPDVLTLIDVSVTPMISIRPRVRTHT